MRSLIFPAIVFLVPIIEIYAEISDSIDKSSIDWVLTKISFH